MGSDRGERGKRFTARRRAVQRFVGWAVWSSVALAWAVSYVGPLTVTRSEYPTLEQGRVGPGVLWGVGSVRGGVYLFRIRPALRSSTDVEFEPAGPRPAVASDVQQSLVTWDVNEERESCEFTLIEGLLTGPRAARPFWFAGDLYMRMAGFGVVRWESFPTTVRVPFYPFVIVPALIACCRRAFVCGTRPGHCPSCGYDLRATPGRCPECGRTANSSGRASAT